MSVRVSAGGIILTPDKKIVLVCQHNDSWSFPKGGIEPNESAFAAAKREIFEETGLSNLTFIRKLGTYERYSIGKGGVGEDIAGGMRKRVMFLFRTSRENFLLHQLDTEITEVRFATLDEALQLLTHPKDKAFLHSIRSSIEDI